jgi:predicted transcriptional regulator
VVAITNDKAHRRDKITIISEILAVSKEGALKTEIMYRANLSFIQLNSYLSFLQNLNLISISFNNGRQTYTITQEGINFLQIHRELFQLLKNKNAKTSQEPAVTHPTL